MAVTTYSDPAIAPRENLYPAGRPKKMPYKPRQAKAVLANTSESNPKHREARSHAKAALKKPRMNGLYVKRKKGM